MKYFIVAFSLMTSVILKGQNPLVTLELEQSVNSCSIETDCEKGVICFDLYATSGTDLVMKSYEIWFIISNNGEGSAGAYYYADAACKLFDQPDLYMVDKPVAVRVAADESRPGENSSINERKKIHSFCLKAGNLNFSSNQVLIAGDSLGFLKSNMSVYLNGAAYDALLKPASFQLSNVNLCSTMRTQELVISGEVFDSENQITWIPEKVHDAALFIIEHSTDGKKFERIDAIAPKVKNKHTDEYTFKHRGNVEDHYRVVAVTHGGDVHSNVVRLGKLPVDQFSVNPNPAKNYLNLNWQSFEEIESIAIANDLGKIVHVKELDGLGQSASIEVAGLPEGIYTAIFMKGKARIHEERFVKVE